MKKIDFVREALVWCLAASVGGCGPVQPRTEPIFLLDGPIDGVTMMEAGQAPGLRLRYGWQEGERLSFSITWVVPTLRDPWTIDLDVTTTRSSEILFSIEVSGREGARGTGHCRMDDLGGARATRFEFPESLTSEQRDHVRLVVTEFLRFLPALPAEEVGLGARWSFVRLLNTSGRSQREKDVVVCMLNRLDPALGMECETTSSRGREITTLVLEPPHLVLSTGARSEVGKGGTTTTRVERSRPGGSVEHGSNRP